jgi:O-6-methylguanine DNA methyltransferase
MRHRINFKDKVYRVVKKIPRGKVLTYKKVAKLVNRPRAWRAVGNILSKSSGIPCHRVTRSDGKVSGYNQGIKKKIALLKKEGLIIKNDKILSKN